MIRYNVNQKRPSSKTDDRCVVMGQGFWQTAILSYLSFQKDIEDDGCTDKGSHGVEGEELAVGREDGEEIAEQCDCCSTEDGDGEQPTVVSAGENEAGEVGSSQSDKGNGTTVGGNGGNQKAGYEE